MIIITATCQANEGKGDEVEQAYKKFGPQAQNDPGTVTFDILRSIDDPSKFLVYEVYENEEAQKYHASTPHFKEFRQTVTPLRGNLKGEHYRQIA